MKTFCLLSCGVLVVLVFGGSQVCGADKGDACSRDVVIVGGTPGGIMAAISAARGGASAVILERTNHIGGLPANGLGATDISTRGSTTGLFMEFVNRVYKHYVDTYGAKSRQVAQCSRGYHFEPSVAEMVFEQMLAEHKDKITVCKLRQFDAMKKNVVLKDGAIAEITILNRESKGLERYSGKVFIDATYEGDLAAAAGAPFRIGREAQSKYNEPMAGVVFVRWGSRKPGEGTTGAGDNAVQAYNYRLCLTKDKSNQITITKPKRYNRKEFVSLIDDIKLNRHTGGNPRAMDYDGIGRVVNMVTTPNDKTDANNQHLAFLSTDLPEENWPWPTASWAWRDNYEKRLRDYTLGLLWFVQNDSELPEDFRKRCLLWGMAKDEYADNGNFPRQVYVREGRRIEGEHLFTALDARQERGSIRPPIYANSITSSHYNLDSHAVRKRQAGRVHLDGFFSYPTNPYTVPYGVIVPKKVEGLLTPVPVSGTHVGFSTLRMEPCWMAMGQAAGVAAVISIREKTSLRKINPWKIQKELLGQNAMLIYFKDLKPGDPHYQSAQFFAVRRFLGREGWTARLAEPVSETDAEAWVRWSGLESPKTYKPGKTTRGEFLDALYKLARKLPPNKMNQLRGKSRRPGRT
ncbi:MAG: FAD-dependent oxidoreductase [Phycisphaerae bacterium]|nr:FAD-dependent oxidoreductase [Phycisphaerae bacterium]